MSQSHEPSPETLCSADELVSLLQKGDIEVLDRITRCFGDHLVLEARARCRTLEQADDVVQEAALAAWRYGPGFRGEGRVDRWLVRLVATACNRARRGLKRDDALHVADAELIADDDSPELLAARAQVAEALGDALNELPAKDRAIVILADGKGLTAPEIAERLEMTPGAVRTRLSRAHARLRAALVGRGFSGA